MFPSSSTAAVGGCSNINSSARRVGACARTASAISWTHASIRSAQLSIPPNAFTSSSSSSPLSWNRDLSFLVLFFFLFVPDPFPFLFEWVFGELGSELDSDSG